VAATRVLASRLGQAKWPLSLAALAAVGWVLPIDLDGREAADLTRTLVALSAGALFLVAALKRLSSTHRTTMLLFLAPLAFAANLNFGTLHGFRTYVHFHDVAHYYLGAKYAAELGQADLYVAMLRAQAESGKTLPARARDLKSYGVVPTAHLLRNSGGVKAAFSPERWQSFRRDVDLFRRGMQDQFADIFVDHGFNGSPVWLLLATPVSQLAPAGDYTALEILTGLDAILMVGALAGLCWAFGLETALLVLLGYCVTFGAGFSWTGGGFLRHPWLASTLLALCCVKKQRHTAAGALFALATLLRVFPIALLVPIVARAVLTWRRSGKLPCNARRLLVGFAAASVALLMATALLPKGFFHWAEFIETMKVHASSLSASRIGLLEVLGFHGHAGTIGFDQMQALVERRNLIATGQIVLLLLPLVLLTFRLAPRLSDVAAAALGLPLIYVGLTLSSYYYSVLVVYLVAFRRRPQQWAWFFTLQGVALTLGQIETRPVLPYVYDSVLLIVLWVVLYRAVPKRNVAASRHHVEPPAARA
jgi:hypothetical protein